MSGKRGAPAGNKNAAGHGRRILNNTKAFGKAMYSEIKQKPGRAVFVAGMLTPGVGIPTAIGAGVATRLVNKYRTSRKGK